MTTWFVISSQGRTGTHMLSTSLAAYPNVASTDEIFNSDNAWAWQPDQDPLAYHNAWRQRHASAVAAGFALHHREFSQPGVAPAIVGHRPRVIVLHRLNFLARLCSELIAAQTGIWSHNGDAPPAPRVDTLHIAPQAAVKAFERFVAETEEDRRLWVAARCPILELTYELLVAHYAEVMEVVQGFLSLPPRTVRPATHRQESRQPRDIIRNYDQLAAALHGTPWASVFD